MLFVKEGGGKILSELGSIAIWIITRIQFRRICKNFIKKIKRPPNLKERLKIWKMLFDNSFTI